MPEDKIEGSPAEWFLLAQRDHAANVAKLRQLAQDAEEMAAEFRNADKKIDAAHYAGMRDGFVRAITVIQGQG